MGDALDLIGRAGPALLAVLGLLALTLWALRRSGLGTRTSGPGAARLEVIATRPLDTRNRLVLVRWAEGEHLLAVGPAGVTMLGSRAEAPGAGPPP